MIPKIILLTHGAGYIGTNSVNKLKPGNKPPIKFEDAGKTYPCFDGNRNRSERSAKFCIIT